MPTPTLAYFSFDTVPGPKGAAVHISAFVQALASTFGSVQLVTVSNGLERASSEGWPGVYQTELPALGKTLIDRVLYFRRELSHWLIGKHFQVIQFRSIFEGLPIALHKSLFCNLLVFEVNGLPSIELKYRYPQIVDDRELMHKLITQEQICLDAADLIVTPSAVTGALLQSRGVAADKIWVIPNGVDLDIFQYQPTFCYGTAPFQLLYFGTLAAWQGVALAVEALALCNREFPTTLTIVGPARPDQVEHLVRLAEKLHVSHCLTLLEPMPQADLARLMNEADTIVAPLTANDRNLLQGCCPLKVLEAMATGTPVISTDLPVVRELGNPDEHFLLVNPGSAKSIKDAIVQLRTDSDLSLHLGKAARQQIETHFTWNQAGHKLVAAYKALGIK